MRSSLVGMQRAKHEPKLCRQSLPVHVSTYRARASSTITGRCWVALEGDARALKAPQHSLGCGCSN